MPEALAETSGADIMGNVHEDPWTLEEKYVAAFYPHSTLKDNGFSRGRRRYPKPSLGQLEYEKE